MLLHYCRQTLIDEHYEGVFPHRSGWVPDFERQMKYRETEMRQIQGNEPRSLRKTLENYKINQSLTQRTENPKYLLKYSD